MMMSKEIRSYTFDMKVERRDGDTPPVIKGHAAVFNEFTDIGGMFREQVLPGAFKRAIKEDDVRALFNHDANFVLGRNTAGTLRMKEDKQGLSIEIDPPNTQAANDLMVSMERGDIDQMSFAFKTIKEDWRMGEDGELDERDLKEVKLFDVSPVTYPAYDGTDVGVRSQQEFRDSRDADDKKRLNIKRKISLIVKKNGGTK
jgi:HK97 family phage prohead protease